VGDATVVGDACGATGNTGVAQAAPTSTTAPANVPNSFIALVPEIQILKTRHIPESVASRAPACPSANTTCATEHKGQNPSPNL
jgi:hypothetical protein